MRTKKFAVLVLMLASVLTGCDKQNVNSEPMATETTKVTTQAATEAKDKQFVVEPNAIEGLKYVEHIYPLGSKYLMIGVNEFDGRSAVLYDLKTNTAEQKTLNRLSEAGDILKVVPGADNTVYVFYSFGEVGEERYVEQYDANLNMIAESAVESMVTVDESTGESVDYPTMQVDAQGNLYFLGFDKAGSHRVMIFDKDKQYLGSVRGDMLVGDELIAAADGKVYLLYHGASNQLSMAAVNPTELKLETVELQNNFPIYHNDTISGTNGYDFYFLVQDALYGVHAAEGKCEAVIDWSSTVFAGYEIRGCYVLPGGDCLIGNTGEVDMEKGTWKMIQKD